jgi:hypothetical protein
MAMTGAGKRPIDTKIVLAKGSMAFSKAHGAPSLPELRVEDGVGSG